ncbi:CPW-WPC family protein [Plasmodium vivax]|uniref:CPW-WPC family protein n=1 Tax=Plasmodium vivax TaxID=5855 RepID=A0A564ZTK1_PLAVI|nr:CPW-WPC family protein [Plasmodium vivax]
MAKRLTFVWFSSVWFAFVCLTLCVVFQSCSGEVIAGGKNEISLKREQNEEVHQRGDRKIRKYNFDSLRKKLHVESKEQGKEEMGTQSSDQQGDSQIGGGTGVSPEEEYAKCIGMIEQEFKGEADAKVREQLESLCLKKREQDEAAKGAEAAKAAKAAKAVKAANEENAQLKTDSLSAANRDGKRSIISQLGLSTKVDVPLEVLKESLSEVKNCVRDYTQRCPLNWKVSETDETVCVAPESYIGPCEKEVKNNLQEDEKMQMERKCSLFWKCDYKCVQNFEGSVCPIDWLMEEEQQQQGGFCKSPESYTGKCIGKIKFSNMTSKEKAIYSNLCEVRWPCKKKCVHDYSVLCPSGWVEGADGYCLATSSYSGNCEKRIYLKHLDEAMKQTYEHKCQFNYPCVKSCEKDYHAVCPQLWLPVSEKECTPSESYNGRCRHNYIFKGNLMEEEKKNFERMCHVSYPCVRDCKRDYSFSCPIGWKETLSFCLAPTSYRYTCEKMMRKNMTEREKIQVSAKCLVFWPCSNYEVVLKNLLHGSISPADYLSVLNGPVDGASGAVVRMSG